MKLPTVFVLEKNFEKNIERLLKESKEPVKVQSEYAGFEVISASNYAEGIAEFKKRKQKLFTFADNVEARVIDYGANGEDAMLFKTYLDSVTGIAYKAKSTKFKLILRCDKLENIKSDFKQRFIPIDYDAEKGVEFDSKRGKYNQPLTRKEAKNHEFWIAAMNGDKEKLVKYVNIWFDKTKAKEGMGVYLRGNTSQDELRALALDCGDGDSDAFGDCGLGDGARFVSGAQQK